MDSTQAQETSYQLDSTIQAANLLELERGILQAFRPDSMISVSEWADTYRFLSQRAAAEPGKWRTERTPYLKEIMDSLSPYSRAKRIVFMKGAQVGGTEAGNNWMGYIIHKAPGPIMAVSPTVELAKRNSKQRIDALLEDSPELQGLVKPSRSRDSGNTILSKEFPGGILIMTGANSGIGLRSMPARYLFLDEVDAFPGDVNGEGDPIMLAERRSATFQGRKKIFLVSTPTLKGLSRITREFEDSDQRYYFVPCPHCETMQSLEFKQLSWPEGKPEEVLYRCKHCEKAIEEHEKTSMLARGRWVATAPSQDINTVGYHLSSLYSPVGWFSWVDAARIYEQSKKHKDLMKSFVNTVLGEPFEEQSDAPDWRRLYERREKYKQGTIPRGVIFLSSGVDVQKDRIECEIVGWGRNKESWSIEYHVLQGDTARSDVWKSLDRVLSKTWQNEDRQNFAIRVMAVDSGYATQDVYNWVKNYPQPIFGAGGSRASIPRTVVAIKGQDRTLSFILGVSKNSMERGRGKIRVWHVSSNIAKIELYRWLKLEWPTETELNNGELFPNGACHFPEYDEEYFKQLTSERRVVRIHKGFPKATWEKDPSVNNEALDCRVYARAAAAIYGLDRFTEKQWNKFQQALEAQVVESIEKEEKTKLKSGSSITNTKKEKKNFWYKPTVLSDDPYL